VFGVSIHGQRFHQQTIAEPFVAENFMGIIWGHWGKAKEILEEFGVWGLEFGVGGNLIK